MSEQSPEYSATRPKVVFTLPPGIRPKLSGRPLSLPEDGDYYGNREGQLIRYNKGAPLIGTPIGRGLYALFEYCEGAPAGEAHVVLCNCSKCREYDSEQSSEKELAIHPVEAKEPKSSDATISPQNMAGLMRRIMQVSGAVFVSAMNQNLESSGMEIDHLVIVDKETREPLFEHEAD